MFKLVSFKVCGIIHNLKPFFVIFEIVNETPLIAIEAFSTKKGLQFAHKFLSSHDALMGVDESTTIKNPSAKRTKNILSLRSLTKYRRILTGSPVTKSPLDLFSQCNFLDPWLLDQSSYYSFRTRYAVCRKIQVHGRQVEIVVGYRNLAELSDKLKPFSYRVLKDDCLDLPSKTYLRKQSRKEFQRGWGCPSSTKKT